MSNQTGWIKCPACDGTGIQETLESIKRFQGFTRSEEQKVQDLLNIIIEEEPNTHLKIHHKREYGECRACKDSKVKGCLPVFQEWISVDDESPEEGKEVMVYPGFILGIYTHGYGWEVNLYDEHGNTRFSDDGWSVTHWMIPSPPKE